jgi:hypothetical protein
VKPKEKGRVGEQPKSTHMPMPFPARVNTVPVLPPRPLPLPPRKYTSVVDGREGPRPPTRQPTVPSIPDRRRLPTSLHAVSDGPPPAPQSTRPPPISLSTCPSIKSLGVSSAKPCLICYDFSGPDTHASLPHFDRSRVTSFQCLAADLTTPFTSKLDKARVLFTWLHRHISYDVHGFLNNKMAPQHPNGVLQAAQPCAPDMQRFSPPSLHMQD